MTIAIVAFVLVTLFFVATAVAALNGKPWAVVAFFWMVMGSGFDLLIQAVTGILGSLFNTDRQ